MLSIVEQDYGTPERDGAKLVTLTIDGREVTVPEGTSVMRAAALSQTSRSPSSAPPSSSRPSAPAACAWCRSKA